MKVNRCSLSGGFYRATDVSQVSSISQPLRYEQNQCRKDRTMKSDINPEYYTQLIHLNSLLLLVAHLFYSSLWRAPGVAQHLHRPESIGDGESCHGSRSPARANGASRDVATATGFGTALDRWTGGLPRGLHAAICSICNRLEGEISAAIQARQEGLHLQTGAACHCRTSARTAWEKEEGLSCQCSSQ